MGNLFITDHYRGVSDKTIILGGNSFGALWSLVGISAIYALLGTHPAGIPGYLMYAYFYLGSVLWQIPIGRYSTVVLRPIKKRVELCLLRNPHEREKHSKRAKVRLITGEAIEALTFIAECAREDEDFRNRYPSLHLESPLIRRANTPKIIGLLESLGYGDVRQSRKRVIVATLPGSSEKTHKEFTPLS